MTIARAQMYRQLYQMGGIGTLAMDYGQPLQVPQQQQSLFTTTGSATSSPLLNYGQTPLGQAGGTPLTRNGYQEGGLSDFYKAEEPIIPRIENIGGLLDQAEKSIGQPANNFTSPLASTFSRFGMQEGGISMDQMMQEQMMQQAPEGIMNAMPQEAGGEEQGLSQEKGTMSLAIIIKLLIDQGIDPETAKQLAIQIQQAFAQGGIPAVEALANQLEQEEGMQQPMMMAEGGLTSIDRARNMLQSRAPSGEFLAYINPQEAGILRSMGGAGQDVNVRGVPSFFFKKALSAVTGGILSATKPVSKAIQSVAKSPIGKLALTAAAVYFGGPMLASSFGISGAAGAAWAGGLANSALQIASGQKFNIGEALLSAGGAYVGAGGLSGTPTPTIDPLTGLPTNTITGTVTQPSIQVGALESNLGQFNPSITPGITGTTTQPSSFFSPTEYGSALSTPTTAVGTYPSLGFEVSPTSPVVNVGAPQPNILDRTITSVQDFGTKLMSDPIGTVQSGIKSAYEYASENKGDTLLAATVALGALSPQQPGEPDDSYQQRKAEYDAKVAEYITQYGGGAKVYSPSFYEMEGAVDPFAGRSTYAAMGGRIGYEGGSMPMGEPRKNPAGIMELDYRKKGGFVPPIGIKEKADDIPAMLSNNEFVFTADAVRNAGRGNVNKGAERMYGLMKQLEAGGVV